MKAVKLAAILIVSIVFAGAAGAAIEYYSRDGYSTDRASTQTIYQTATVSSTLTYVQIVTRNVAVTTLATYPPNVEIEGSVYSEVYPSLYVSFIHCQPVAYVACDTFTSNVTITENYTKQFGSSTYIYYQGTYEVVVPNNQTYGVAVGLANSINGSSLAVLATIPLYALSPVLGNYNIDCFFPGSNYSLSAISCMSE